MRAVIAAWGYVFGMLAAFGMLALRFTAGEVSGGPSSDRYLNDDHVPANIFALRENEPYIVLSWGLGMRQRAEEQIRVCLPRAGNCY